MLLLLSWLAYSSTLKTETICSCETSIFLRATRLYNSEGSILNKGNNHGAGWCSNNALDFHSRVARFESRPEQRLSWQVFRGFCETLQEDIGIVSRVDHDCFHPNSFQFDVEGSSHHSQVYSLRCWQSYKTNHVNNNKEQLESNFEVEARSQTGKISLFSPHHAKLLNQVYVHFDSLQIYGVMLSVTNYLYCFPTADTQPFDMKRL